MIIGLITKTLQPTDEAYVVSREFARTQVMSGRMSASEADHALRGMNIAVRMYDEDGGVRMAAVHESFLPRLIEDHDPGAEFCKEYKKKYSHLYR